MGELDSFFLADGGQTPQSVADRLIDFIEPAKRTLQVAIYDFHAREGASSRVADALESARSRGVDVRVAYNTGRSEEVDEHRPMQCDPEVVDGLEDAEHAAARGDLDGFNAAGDKVTPQLDAANTAANAYGFKECGSTQ